MTSNTLRSLDEAFKKYDTLDALDAVHAGAEALDVPLLAIYGTQDRVVNTDGVRDFYAAAGSTDKRVTAVDFSVYPGTCDRK